MRRFVVLLALPTVLSGCASIPSPLVQANPAQDAWVLQSPMAWRVGQGGNRIIVPAGFVTDYASVPRWLWTIFSPHERYSRAAVIHDYLYWTQVCTRLQADNIFYIGMIESKVPALTREAVYGALRTPFGQKAWDDNKARRLQGYPKVLPPQLRATFTQMAWPASQEVARTRGAKDPEPTVSGNICALGDTKKVPPT